MAFVFPQSPNGGVKVGADLGADSDFVVIHTVIGHAAGDVGASDTANNQKNLQKLFEIINNLVNIKYVNVSSTVADLSDAGEAALYGLGSAFDQAATTVYTIKFMTERTEYVTDTALTTALDGITVPFPTTSVPKNGGPVTVSAYETSTAADVNIAITVFSNL